jgi:hypothetical protein
MGIRWMRTGQIRNSRVMEVIAWSKEVCAFIEKKHNIKPQTWLDVVGTLGTVRWTVDYPDMASFDKAMMAINMDPEYIRFLEKAVKDELFIDGTGVDIILREM